MTERNEFKVGVLVSVTIVVLLVTGATAGRGAGPVFMGSVFIAIAVVTMVLFWGMALCLFYSGRFLGQHRRHNYCFVVAIVCCLVPPYCTVLGILTLVVLSRPSVRDLFEAGA